MRKGVPKLLSILKRSGIKGTFYLSMGPDASGRALLQLLKNPLFLKKMIRTRAARLYGFKTALYGFLLPSPMIALAFPKLVQQIAQEGHEVQFHAWNHRRWQDELGRRSPAWIEEWFEKGIGAYRTLMGRNPSSFGAPAWLVDDRVLEAVKKYDFRYLSCSRAARPFVEAMTGLTEIPSDLPCLEEIGVEGGIEPIIFELKKGGLHVLPVHAEVEGGIWDIHFIKILETLSKMHYDILTLSEINDRLKADALPVRKYRFSLLPGRSAACAV